MDAFEALADPVRRRLLLAMADGPRTAGALAMAEPASRPSVSRHLRVLRETGLVAATPRGRERVYTLSPDGLAPVHALLAELEDARRAAPLLAADRLDALELEVRRTVRDRASIGRASAKEMSA